MERLKLLVKPTHKCNLNCRYCYDKQFSVMDDMNLSIVENLAKFASNSSNSVLWIWHGGEPLMMPLDFYKESYLILDKYGINDVSMQSNGILYNKDYGEFFKEVGWRIGFSFDYTSQNESRGREKDVLKIFNLYKDITKSSTGGLKVIDKYNVKNFHKDYYYAKNHNLDTYNFNRVFKTETAELIEDDFLNIYLDEYSKLFDIWIQDEDPLGIRNFEGYIPFLLGTGDMLCSHKGQCVQEWLGVNPKGVIYPCDRWYPDEFIYGNLDDFYNMEELREKSDSYKNMVSIIEERKKYCKDTLNCPIYDFCNGGCNATQIGSTGGRVPDETYCYLNKKEVYHMFNVLNNIKSSEIKNPKLQGILNKSGLRNLDFIEDILTKKGDFM